jgi:electron transport complex protein RnfD
MINMLVALAPAFIFGVVIFGVPALLTVVVSAAAAVLAEFAFRKLSKQDIRIKDCSAAVTGVLLALILPPSTPLWMTALGSIFAVVVAKEFFGGLGANVFNPALIGRAFLIMSFPAAITTWHKPVGFGTPLTDVVSTATPLNIIRQGGTIADVGASMGTSDNYWSVIKPLLLGTRSGSIGETSILLIAAGAIFLLVTKTIDWRTPVAMIGAAFLASLVLGMDPVLGILSGGVIFGAVFMATDYVSAPITDKGKLIFGVGAGIITVLIRKWGAFPEGVTYSILVMNACTPFLNRLLPRKYGFVSRKKEKRRAVK